MAHLKGSDEEIEVMLINSSDKEVQKNRNKLKPITDIVTLLGRLGFPFRGHSRVRTYFYFLWRTHDIGHVYVRSFFHCDFLKFSIFLLVLIILYCLKTYC